VIFDWDGTLMDSTSVIAAALQSACRDIGIAVPTERDARFVIGLGAADTFRHVAPRLDEEGRGRLAERYRHHFLANEHQAPLYEGVREMLADLHGRGHRLAVATGKARRGLERVLDATGLRPWFEATRCADEGFAKPHPDMLLMLMDITGAPAARADAHDARPGARHQCGRRRDSVSYGAQ
jgi:phosphoglycolate phosphatase